MGPRAFLILMVTYVSLTTQSMVWGGGALDFESSTAILTVKGNVLFAHNDGSEYGGAIQVYRARRIDFIGDI